jgi:hypothetical protein
MNAETIDTVIAETGDIVFLDGDPYILAITSGESRAVYISLVSLESGNRWTNSLPFSGGVGDEVPRGDLLQLIGYLGLLDHDVRIMKSARFWAIAKQALKGKRAQTLIKLDGGKR